MICRKLGETWGMGQSKSSPRATNSDDHLHPKRITLLVKPSKRKQKVAKDQNRWEHRRTNEGEEPVLQSFSTPQLSIQD